VTWQPARLWTIKALAELTHMSRHQVKYILKKEGVDFIRIGTRTLYFTDAEFKLKLPKLWHALQSVPQRCRP